MQEIITEYIIKKKKILLIVLVIVVVLLVGVIFINKNNKFKVYVSNNYIYTKATFKHNDIFSSELPYINIIGSEITDINNKLIEYYYEIIALNEDMMTYEYYINGDIASLLVEVRSLGAPERPSEVFIYNIDIKKGKVLSNEDLFNEFNLSFVDISENIKNGIKEYYVYELSKEYIDKNCDFECYLSQTYSNPILDNCNFYIKDGSLYAYKRIILEHSMIYDGESGFDLFSFKIGY